jgi:TatD DNase family protein
MHDAHCHPFDLARKTAETGRVGDTAEADRLAHDVPCLASAWGKEDFDYNKSLSEEADKAGQGGVPMYLSFGVHPQLPTTDKTDKTDKTGKTETAMDKAMDKPMSAASFALLETLVREGGLDAVGEIGFDLYDERYRETEKEQDELFRDELALAARYDLPVVLHVRKAMHKVFACKKTLRNIKAAIFHGYAGTEGEAASLLAAGVNAYFSFGTAILNNHKQAERAVALLPAERLLFETDAPYQPLRGKLYSHYHDLAPILEKAASLRKEAGSDYADREALEALTDPQFRRLFGRGT